MASWLGLMSLKVLGIYGSPRAGGNSDLLLREALRGAAEAGGMVEELFLRELDIAPCLECGACSKTGTCVQMDGMQLIYPKLEKADRMIIASPVFFYTVTAQLKAMIDRCQALWSKKFCLEQIPPPEITGRKGFFLSVAGTKGPKVFDCSVVVVRIFLESIGVRFEGYLGYRRIDDKGEILSHPEALAEAFEAGKRLAT